MRTPNYTALAIISIVVSAGLCTTNSSRGSNEGCSRSDKKLSEPTLFDKAGLSPHPVYSGSKSGQWVEDEPQLRNQNEYAQEIRRILYGDHVTAASIERRKWLWEIGPSLQESVRGLLKNRRIAIALFPLGSALKGYAAYRS